MCRGAQATSQPTPAVNDHAEALKAGDALRQAGNYVAAVEAYDTAIDLKPDDAYVWGSRGVAYYGLGQHQRAILDYDKAIQLKLELDYAEAYYSRGNEYGDLGQYRLAIQDYDTAMQLKPDYAGASGAYYDRGKAYAGLGQYERATQDFEKGHPA